MLKNNLKNYYSSSNKKRREKQDYQMNFTFTEWKKGRKSKISLQFSKRNKKWRLSTKNYNKLAMALKLSTLYNFISL